MRWRFLPFGGSIVDYFSLIQTSSTSHPQCRSVGVSEPIGVNGRRWAEKLIAQEPTTFASLLIEAGKGPLQECREFYERLLGDRIGNDSMDITAALIGWARRMRGFDVSHYRAEAWEFIVHVVDAALWLGWTHPSDAQKSMEDAR